MRGLSAGISLGVMALVGSLSAVSVVTSVAAQDIKPVVSDQGTAKPYVLNTVVEGLVLPWSIAFLPNGDMLVTELDGRLRLIRNGELVREPVSGVPEVYRASQGGLMDIALHPDFETNQWVYLTLATGTPERNALRVIRGRFTGSALENIQTIFEAAKTKDTAVHYGARMTFLPDNTLLVAVGDGFDYREEAQNLSNHFGTIIRVTDNGNVPDDNPYVGNDDVQPEIWSYGHRNQQGIVYDEVRNVVFESEHGPQGGDELNIIKPSLNYGWPAITYGLDYSGAVISPYTAYEAWSSRWFIGFLQSAQAVWMFITALLSRIGRVIFSFPASYTTMLSVSICRAMSRASRKYYLRKLETVSAMCEVPRMEPFIF